MKEILKVIFFSCLISVSYGSSADNFDEKRERLKEQMNKTGNDYMGPEIGSKEWSTCRAESRCQYP